MGVIIVITTIKAIENLKPSAKFKLIDDKLEWLDTTQTQPTDSEIQAEITRLQTIYDNNQYQRDRATEYPAIADQLDDIFHNGIDGWKATIQLTKDKYPKGGN
jgi:hypothetical protein